MTRFARAKGSKASNQRLPEEATSWKVMKKQLVEAQSARKKEEKKLDRPPEECTGNEQIEWAVFEEARHHHKKGRRNTFNSTVPSPSKCSIKKKKKKDTPTPEKQTDVTANKDCSLENGVNGDGESKNIFNPLKRKHEVCGFVVKDVREENYGKNELDNSNSEAKKTKMNNGRDRRKRKMDFIVKDLSIVSKTQTIFHKNIHSANHTSETESKSKQFRRECDADGWIVKDVKNVKDENQKKFHDNTLSSNNVCETKINSEQVRRENNADCVKDVKNVNDENQKKFHDNTLSSNNVCETKINNEQGGRENNAGCVKDVKENNNNSCILKQTEKTNIIDREFERKDFGKGEKRKRIEDDNYENRNAYNLSEKQKYNENKKRKMNEPQNNSRVISVANKTVEVSKFDGIPLRRTDVERLSELRYELKRTNFPQEEVEHAIKLERRRAEKSLSREKQKVCFNCRRSGHFIADCPDLQNNGNGSLVEETVASGICYKCGSTEHSFRRCNLNTSDNFKFASCFICKEQGHIARECPDNPRGVYPNGGACRQCGDVTHYVRDCPEVVRERRDEVITLNTWAYRAPPEALETDLYMTNRSVPRRDRRIVRF